MLASHLRRLGLATALLASALCLGSREARAALGIIIVETDLEPVGDPLTEFHFSLALAPMNSLSQGDNLTLLDVPNFSGNYRYVFSYQGIDFSQYFTLSNAPNPDGTTQIKLEWNNAILNLVNSGTSNLSIGDLFVETNVEFAPSPGSPLFDPIHYTTQTHGPGGINLGSGVTVAQAIVPEPASSTLLGVGAASGALLARRRRRARPA